MQNDMQDMPFEAAMQELERVVETLAGGNISLDEMVALYERGSALGARCESLLNAYEARLDAVDAANGEDGAAQ